MSAQRVDRSRQATALPVYMILTAALIVGTLDLLAAFLDYYLSTGKSPVVTIPKYIASGFFGKKAFAGGGAMVLAGILFHYLISFGACLVFFVLCVRSRLMQLNWILRGLLYGLIVWIITALVIVPLSGASHPPLSAMKLTRLIRAMLIVVVAFGLPLSYIAKRYWVQSAASSAGSDRLSLP